MGLTQVSTDGDKNDAITKTKIPANQIEASELADNAVDTNAIADQAVALSKLPHGDGSSDGKFSCSSEYVTHRRYIVSPRLSLEIGARGALALSARETHSTEAAWF